MEDEALVPVEPGADLGVLVGGVVVEEDAPDRAGADAARPCHQLGGPMGGLAGRIGKRQRDLSCGAPPARGRNARGPRLPAQGAPIPSLMNRSCQRHTQVFDLSVRRMISLVPTPSALERMIAARQACFCEALRSLLTAASRRRSDGETVMDIPVRIRQTRTNRNKGIPIRTLLSGKDH